MSDRVFRVTQQEARVVERVYDVSARGEEEAQELFEGWDYDQKQANLVHEETLRAQIEVVGVEEV